MLNVSGEATANALFRLASLVRRLQPWSASFQMSHPAFSSSDFKTLTYKHVVPVIQLGTVEAVAQAKGELFDTARAGDTVVLNMDDPLVAALSIPGMLGPW